MAKLTWDGVSERRFETGVDRGVLFVSGTDGYDPGVAWNGLVSVTESPGGAEANKQYADNQVYLNLVSAETFSGTVEAFTSPVEFAVCDGLAEPAAGVTVGQQERKSFALAYRTKVGNDVLGQNAGYKIHLLWGLLAKPSERQYQTINESPEAMTLSWEVESTPVEVPGMNPTSIMTVDSTRCDAADFAALTDLIWGTETLFSEMPTPAEVLAIFA